MTQTKKNYDFPFGTVVGFHGLQGDVKVRPSTNNPELLLRVKQLRAELGNVQDLILDVHSIALEKRLLVIRLKDFPDRTAVEHLLNANLFASASELLPLEEEEFWVKDLVGMEVYTTDGALVGTVCSIIHGGNDILEISPTDQPEDKTILVPFVKELVPHVDMKKRRLEVVNVPGLLDPQ